MSKMYSTKDAVKLMESWGVSFKPATLEVWRSQKRGPSFRKVHNRVFYTEEALREFCSGLDIKTIDSM